METNFIQIGNDSEVVEWLIFLQTILGHLAKRPGQKTRHGE